MHKLFGRRSTVPPTAALPVASAAPSGMPVVDPAGRAFETARTSDLGVALWRVETVDDLPGLAADTVVLYAAHDSAELERGYALMRRQPTVVLGMGLGAHSGSRALMLGAIGYVHDGLNRAQFTDAFADALTRQRYRAMRTNGLLAATT